MVATVTVVDTHLTPTARHTAGAIHTTADGTDIDGIMIMMIGIMVDGVAAVDGVTMDTSLAAVTVDGVMAVDSVMKGMAAAGLPILVADTVAADPTRHQIVRRYFTPSI